MREATLPLSGDLCAGSGVLGRGWRHGGEDLADALTAHGDIAAAQQHREGWGVLSSDEPHVPALSAERRAKRSVRSRQMSHCQLAVGGVVGAGAEASSDQCGGDVVVSPVEWVVARLSCVGRPSIGALARGRREW